MATLSPRAFPGEGSPSGSLSVWGSVSRRQQFQTVSDFPWQGCGWGMGGEPGVPGCPMPGVTSDACTRPRRRPGPAFPQVPCVFRPARQAGRAACCSTPAPGATHFQAPAHAWPRQKLPAFQTRLDSHPAVPRSCPGLLAACGLALPSPSLTLCGCPPLCSTSTLVSCGCVSSPGGGMGDGGVPPRRPNPAPPNDGDNSSRN